MTIIARGDLVELLGMFNEQYALIEKHQPAQGYLVQFDVREGGVHASLHSYGNTRNGNELLSGISQARDNCLFCPQTLANNPQKLNNVVRRVTTDAVKSLSGQVLIVPKNHFSQWFDAPVELQVDLLEEAIELRAQYPESQKLPVELHCGSAAGQTVFHIHVRTGIYLDS